MSTEVACEGALLKALPWDCDGATGTKLLSISLPYFCGCVCRVLCSGWTKKTELSSLSSLVPWLAQRVCRVSIQKFRIEEESATEENNQSNNQTNLVQTHVLPLQNDQRKRVQRAEYRFSAAIPGREIKSHQNWRRHPQQKRTISESSMYVHTYVCIHTYQYVGMYVCMYVCMYVIMYQCIQIYVCIRYVCMYATFIFFHYRMNDLLGSRPLRTADTLNLS